MKKFYAIITVLTLAALFGCAPAEHSLTFTSMDTVMTLRVWADKPEEVVSELRAVIAKADERFSAYDETGDIGRINASGGERVAVQPDTAVLLKLAAEVCKKTSGAFNPLMLPAVRAWGFTPQGMIPSLPSDEEREALKAQCDSSNLYIYENEVELENGAMADLGAIAKGYAGDLAAEWLSENGVKSAILSLGGNVVCHGFRPNGSPWSVGIRDPRESGGLIARVAVANAHVVTSSGAERFYITPEGRRVQHIIDPRTMEPADSGLLSVTIIAREGALADALSTAVFVLGEEEGIDMLSKNYPNVGYVLLREDGGLVSGGSAELCDVTFEVSP